MRFLRIHSSLVFFSFEPFSDGCHQTCPFSGSIVGQERLELPVGDHLADVLFQLEDGWQPVYKYQRTIYNDNSNIPFILHGNSIKRKQIRTKTMAEDMVPTILEILHMPIPDQCSGNILEEVLFP